MTKTLLAGVSQEKYLNSDLDVLIINNQHCHAVIALQGAQVLSFKQKKSGKDLLWLSKGNTYQPSKAIRGGIPLCFPWFGPAHMKTGPSHGFARNKVWQCTNIFVHEDSHLLQFKLRYDDQTLTLWPFKFELVMTIQCGELLRIDFELVNLDAHPFLFTFAWHSYFKTQISTTAIHGLQELEYIDQLKDQTQKQEQNILQVDQEIDRIYPITKGKFCIQSEDISNIYISTNTQSAVVWNPWIEKSKTLLDIVTDDWKNFICLENGQVGKAGQVLNPQEKIKYYINIGG